MSYILDALRKSEQERNPEKVPDLATHHHHVAGEQKKKFPYWILFIAVLVINGFILLFLMKEEPIKESPTMTASPAASLTSNKLVEDVAEKISVEKEPVPEVIPEQVIEKEAPKVIKETPQQHQVEITYDRSTMLDISELPAGLQSQLPSMEFSTHIYVEDGGSFIIMNGKSLNEGMIIQRGLRLLKILSDGIVLEFKGQQFFMASMTNW